MSAEGGFGEIEVRIDSGAIHRQAAIAHGLDPVWKNGNATPLEDFIVKL
ncbi:MAG: hypothetical protein GY862_19630 [Gammaproteobacteria bacterium]|nr:hypothetical protein [Gammaproteobacteria bacterium]